MREAEGKAIEEPEGMSVPSLREMSVRATRWGDTNIQSETVRASLVRG